MKDTVSLGTTENDLIRDGLRALAARDAAVDHWLREQVAPTLDALTSDPAGVMSLEEARKRLRSRIDALIG